MKCRSLKLMCLALLTGFSSFIAQQLQAQNAFETMLMHRLDSVAGTKMIKQQLYPNDAITDMLAPSGFGGYGTYLFGFWGMAYPEVYTKHKLDMITAGGFCFGNPEKTVNIAASVNMARVNEFADFSVNLVASRSLGKGSSISGGGLQLFTGDGSDANKPTFFLAFSHAVQTLPSRTPGGSKLTYTMGIGSGRFWEKSPLDVLNGKGKHGTGVFGGVSYELLHHVNLNAEWTGMNLGITMGISPLRFPLAVGLGVTNLTNYSADKPNGVCTIGLPLSLKRN